MEMTDFLSPGYAAYRQAIPKSIILLWDMFFAQSFKYPGIKAALPRDR